jgi:hypothetical protein
MNGLAKETNVKKSLKKFFVDTLGSANVTFDVSLAAPDIRKQGADSVKQWYNIAFGQFGRQAMSEYQFQIFCLSRQDSEGIKLAEMSDLIISLLVDSDKTDGMRRIPLYEVGSFPWVQISSMVVQEIDDQTELEFKDTETKFKILLVKLRWGTTI